MKKQTNTCRAPGKTLAIAVAMATLGVADLAMAFDIPTGSPDATLVFDNTVRYTGGVRLEDPDYATAAATASTQGESRFGKGDMVVNRLDWLGELDFAWKRKSGFRVSAAAWRDFAQDECAVKNNTGGSTTNYFSTGSYCDSDEFKYAVKGPGAQVLDAFVYTGFDLGGVQTNVRFGKHTTYWGEALFETDNNINFNNGPMDKNKAAVNPGIEAKELFMPWHQVSLTSQITSKVSLAAFYNIKWARGRAPEAGSWFQYTDFYFTDANLGPTGARRNDISGENGSWGVMARWRPDFLDSGVMGFYYRNFTMTDPAVKMINTEFVVTQAMGAPNFALFNGGMLQYYSKNVELYGWSMNKVIGTTSVGTEISYRKNSNLNNPSGFVHGVPGTTEFSTARGNTFHALINIMQGLTPTALYDTGIVLAEIGYQRLIKVTENADLYKGTANVGGTFYGYGAGKCTGVSTDVAVSNGCGTRDYLGASISVTPQWLGAIAGVNLSMPIYFGAGLVGNQATSGSNPSEARYRYSIGLEAEFLNTPNPLKIRLQYADQYQGPRGTQGLQMYNDRAWLSLNAKMSF